MRETNDRRIIQELDSNSEQIFACEISYLQLLSYKKINLQWTKANT